MNRLGESYCEKMFAIITNEDDTLTEFIHYLFYINILNTVYKNQI